MILSRDSKRLVIFLFYDSEGIVDDYIPYMLKDIKKNVSEIFVVANGKMNDAGKEKLAGIADTIWERKNKGFDVWGYKESFEKIGWDKLYTFDEVIMMNYTIMGPVDTFDEMFDVMSETDIDFWGITKHHTIPFDPFGCIECGYVREHLQSHFIAVRKPMLISKEYRIYWEEMPMIHNYNESVAFHETKFTFTFEELGYSWVPYVDTTDIEKFNYNPIVKCPTQLIVEKRCPIFKRRSFMHTYSDFINDTIGEASYELMEYLKKHTSYDTNMIWDNLLRCNNMAAIKDCLHLNYTLSEKNDSSVDVKELKNKVKVALIFHAYFSDLVDSTYHYVNSMPEWADIYITTDTQEKKEFFEKKFRDHKFGRLQVLLIENRGRDVSALLVAAKGFVMEYDVVCFAHDKKVTQLEPSSVGAAFAYHCLENTLGTEQYVNNVINLFYNNPRLGLLTPMPPYHADYYPTIGNEWAANFEATRILGERLGLRVDISEKFSPIAPLGTMFWFRTQGMKRLFDEDWEYKDFPEEPNKNDGTLLHAIERIYGFVEQDAGYYCGWCASEKGAAINTTNMYYMLNQYNQVFKESDVMGNFVFVLDSVSERLCLYKNIKNAAEALAQSFPNIFGLTLPPLPTMRFYLDDGKGFSEKLSYPVNSASKSGKFKCMLSVPKEIRTLQTVRFDPGEAKCVKVSNLKVTYIFSDETRYVVKPEAFSTNGILCDKTFVFLMDDPQIMWTYDRENIPERILLEGEFFKDISQEEIICCLKDMFRKKKL